MSVLRDGREEGVLTLLSKADGTALAAHELDQFRRTADVVHLRNYEWICQRFGLEAG